MKVILLSGSVGTGKTTLAKKIAKKHSYKYIDLNKIMIKNRLCSGYDKKLKTYLIDIKKSNKLMISLIKEAKINNEKGIVIDSHLSHYLPAKYADVCIITKTSLNNLKKRLEKRGYTKNKMKENIEAEILDVCLVEALENKHKVKIVRN